MSDDLVRLALAGTTPDPRYTCCRGLPATVDVYANGVYYGYFCLRCVRDIPGYDGTLRLDDVIPDLWAAHSPDGTIQGFYGGTSAEEVRRAFEIPEVAVVEAVTARVLFKLPA